MKDGRKTQKGEPGHNRGAQTSEEKEKKKEPRGHVAGAELDGSTKASTGKEVLRVH